MHPSIRQPPHDLIFVGNYWSRGLPTRHSRLNTPRDFPSETDKGDTVSVKVRNSRVLDEVVGKQQFSHGCDALIIRQFGHYKPGFFFCKIRDRAIDKPRSNALQARAGGYADEMKLAGAHRSGDLTENNHAQ